MFLNVTSTHFLLRGKIVGGGTRANLTRSCTGRRRHATLSAARATTSGKRIVAIMSGCLMRISACIVWICAASAVSGCSPGTYGDPVLPVDYAGDRGRITYDELIVSLPVRGATAPYQNLHLAVTVFLYETERRSAGAFELQGIV